MTAAAAAHCALFSRSVSVASLRFSWAKHLFLVSNCEHLSKGSHAEDFLSVGGAIEAQSDILRVVHHAVEEHACLVDAPDVQAYPVVVEERSILVAYAQAAVSWRVHAQDQGCDSGLA